MISPKRLTTTTAGGKLAGLTHLRTLAILLVFLYHYRIFSHPGWIDAAGAFGWTGVDLFFVLSGYLIASQLFKSIAQTGSFSLSGFYIKRTLRIIPAYLVVLACYVAFPWCREREALSPLWKFLTFTQNFGLNLRSYGTFSHAWSLCVEEQFYLLLPLVMMALLAVKAGKKAGGLLAALFIAGFFIRFACYTRQVAPLKGDDAFTVTWYTWIYYPTWSRLDGLLAGIAIAGLVQFKPVYIEKITCYGNRLLVPAIVLLLCAWWLCREQQTPAASVAGFPLIAVGYGVLLLAAISPGCVLYRFGSRISGTIATLSYSLYLSHKACIHITQQQLVKLGIAADSTGMFFCCTASSLAGAFLLYRLAERPFMELRDRLFATGTQSLHQPQPGSPHR